MTSLDLLQKDAQIQGQTFCLLSFLPPKYDLAKEFEAGRRQKIEDKLKENENDLYLKIKENPKYTTAVIMDCISSVFDDLKEKEKDVYHKSRGGVKVRGVFSSSDEAASYAKKLQELDPVNNIFNGTVGDWLPFNPPVSEVENQVYEQEDLNDLMKEYHINRHRANKYYEDRKKELIEDEISKLSSVEEEKEEKKKKVYEDDEE